ncbi:MAG: glucan biosynthesis protein [Verrucomicrobiota bacterium]
MSVRLSMRARSFFCLLMSGVLPAAAAIERVEVNHDHVRRLAAERAREPYRSTANDLPKGLAGLSRMEELGIRFRSGEQIWGGAGLPFDLELIHRGPLRPEAMTVREFSATHEQTIPFSKNFFDYGDASRVGWLRSSLNFSGVRVRAAIHRPDALEEWMTFFAGAWRTIGSGQVPGAWAKGLMVDTGVTGQTEEMPLFTDVWLGKPEPGARRLTVHALLDTPSLTGAYQFQITPGPVTVAEVRAELYFRKEVALVGFAPLTTSFWYGENTPRPPGLLWPERHDSDGLLVRNRGQAPLWRPLGNPVGVQRSELATEALEGFGLMQRDRDPAHYQDLDMPYHQKSSVWIEPIGRWGAGSVRLIELPNPQGADRNVIAFWTPAAQPDISRPVSIAYRVIWGGEPDAARTSEPLAKVVSTRSGVLPGAAGEGAGRARLFWVDFQGEAAAGLQDSEVSAQVGARNARVLAHRLMRNPALPGWRVEIEVEADEGARLVELSCQLRRGYEALSESWTSPWTP